MMGINVYCQRLTRERAYSPVLRYNEGLWKSQVLGPNSQRWKYAILTNIFCSFVTILHEEHIIQQLKA
jgi:hypothetical protein